MTTSLPLSRPSVRARLRGLYGIVGPTAPLAAGEARRETLRQAEALVSAGVAIVQLRDKHASGRELLETARALRRLTREAGALFVVNDRADVALMAEADGVHVGQDDLPLEDVRRVAAALGRADFLVGLSTHDLDQVRDAAGRGADYLGFGPVYETSTKQQVWGPRGAPLLREAVLAAGDVPVVAIGGITLENVDPVAEAGAAMAAVIGDVVRAEDPAARASAFQARLLRPRA